MRAFFACVRKDLRLFLSGAGLLSLVLPFLLLGALGLFMDDAALNKGYVQPFSIALRDEDNSPMSRSLTRQVAQVELFTAVIDAEGLTDKELFEMGAAAVVTLPEDYFYRVYTMEDCPVDILLNAAMPLEAELTRSILVSVLDILSADQQAARAVHLLQYGSITEGEAYTLYADAAEHILSDALSRQAVFDTSTALRDTEDHLRMTVFLCCISLLSLFLPLCVLKTLPEELEMGILPRYRAAGGSAGALIGSKLFACLVLYLPALVLLLLFSGVEPAAAAAGISLLLFFGSFGLILLLSALCRSGARCQLFGNILILYMLVFGGVLYPMDALPGTLRFLCLPALPGYALQGLRASMGGLAAVDILAAVWPLPSAAALALPGVLLLKRRGSS